MAIGQVVVYHNPNGTDQPGVISAQKKVGADKDKRVSITLIIFGLPANFAIENANPGSELGEFESAK